MSLVFKGQPTIFSQPEIVFPSMEETIPKTCLEGLVAELIDRLAATFSDFFKFSLSLILVEENTSANRSKDCHYYHLCQRSEDKPSNNRHQTETEKISFQISTLRTAQRRLARTSSRGPSRGDLTSERSIF